MSVFGISCHRRLELSPAEYFSLNVFRVNKGRYSK